MYPCEMKNKFFWEQALGPVPQRVNFLVGWGSQTGFGACFTKSEFSYGRFLVGWARSRAPYINLGVGFFR